MIEQLKNNPSGNFFLLAGPCVIEGEDMAMRIAEKVVNIYMILWHAGRCAEPGIL